MATDTLWQQSEKVRKKGTLPKWCAEYSLLLSLVPIREVERVGERDYRIPVELTTAGRYSTFDPNFGDTPRGSSSTGTYMTASYFSTIIAFEMSQLKAMVTSDPELAAKAEFKKTLADAPAIFGDYEDRSFLSDGGATVAVATAHAVVSSASVYTLDAGMGTARVSRGMYVTVYSASYAAILASNVYITKVDYDLGKVTLSISVPGAGNTDILCYDGVSGTGSAPAWKKGLFYVNNSSTSGTYYGITRSAEPEVIPSNINMSSGEVGVMDGLLLLDKIGKRTGTAAKQLTGIANTAQRAVIIQQQTTNSQYQRDPSGRPGFADELPNLGETFPFAGVKHYLHYRQDTTRIDWIKAADWGRAQLPKGDVDFFTIQGDRPTRFFSIPGSNGAPTAGTWFALQKHEDLYCVNPRNGGFLYSCGKPSRY